MGLTKRKVTIGPGARNARVRWVTYFRERFPPLPYAVALSLFTLTVLAALRKARGRDLLPDAAPALVAFAIVFLLFLQLRLLDEFKDQADDARYRPELPVPRGLVTLHELGRLWVVAAALQFALAALLGTHAVVALAGLLAYSGLMRVEFFVSAWLRAHALAYLLSHMLVVPLAALFVAVCETPPGALAALAPTLAPLLAFGYLSFCVFELGRKIRAPAEERPGVDTYSARWGARHAALAWGAALWAAAGCGGWTAHRLGVGAAFAALALLLAAAGSVQVVGAVRNPATAAHGRFLTASSVWFVGAHAGMLGALAFGPR